MGVVAMDNNGSGSGDACPEQELDPPSLLLMLPLLLSLVWILLDIFYSSALFGWAVTRLPTLFLTDSAIHLGGIQVSLLTGRILFRDLHYYCRDFSIRVTDGYAAFHWWKRVGVGDYALCCPGSPERRTALVRFQLNGFQLHWYNRSDVYDTWGQVDLQDTPRVAESGSDESLLWSLWKELRPSLHFNINKGRMVFGNHLLERSLTVYCHTARAHYHTTEASNAYDELMHVVKVWTSEVKAVLEPSNDPATAVSDNVEKITPLLRSDSATVTYSWDSPGLVQWGDSPDPKFSWDVELGPNAVINYGSYANHQRHLLQSFFFPNDYTERPASHIPRTGEKRIYTSMEITVRLSSRGAFNIPFQDEKNKLHQIGLSLGKGSEIKVHQPWITNENGYTTSVTGVLEDVVITSDLSYPHLASATSLQLNVELGFPRVWNSTQQWDMKLAASQVEVSILFSYIDFINALIDDWLGSDGADLLHFVPIEWTVTLSLSDYEIYMFTSRYNWLDKDGFENTRLAFCGSTGRIKLHFPFTVFNPIEQRVAFTANGQDLVVRHFVPPSCSSREAVLALNSANKYHWRVMRLERHSEMMSGHQRTADMFTYNREPDSKEVFPMGYRGHTHLENGWVDLACGPSISLVIDYVSRSHHPSPTLPNTMQVDIDAPTVLLRGFGFLMTDLLALKENYPGEYIDFSTYHSTSLSDQYAPLATRSPLGEALPAAPPPEVPDDSQERFVDVVVDFTLHNITAELPTFPSQGNPVDATLPSVCTDRLAVHVEYTSSDTKVFLCVSPLTALIPSWPSGAAPELGHVACGGLQLNCHGLTAMLCGERVEYAWLMQLQIQRITAALTTLQLAEVVSWLQTTVHQIVGVADATVEAPNGHLIKPLVEPLSEDIKYLLFDLSVGEADVCLLEGGGVLRLQSPGLDMGLCKLHCDSETLGMSVQLHALTCSVCTPVAGEARILSEAGRVDIGLVQGDIALQEPKDCVPSRQLAFLKRADTRTRRLWFLWGEVGCGCWGGCQFLDDCIKRSPPRLPSSCAVYNSECSLPSGTLSRAFGLHSLTQSLQSVSLHDLECPTLLHHGLLTYYDQRYQSVGDTSPSQPSAGSDTESFVSARASPSDSGSQSDTNEFYSLENVNEAGLEGHTLPEQLWRRPRSKTEGGNVSKKKSDAAHVLEEDSTLHSILPCFMYHTIPLHIGIKTPSQELRERLPHCRQHSDTPFSTQTGPIHTGSALDIPLTPPPMSPRGTRGSHSTTGNIFLRLPLLIPHGQGNMPILNMSASQEKNTSAECGQTDKPPPQFTVGVNISVLEPVSATLSPLITHLITSMTTSLTYYFQQRSALAVLTGCSLEASLSLNSYLSQLLQPSSDPQPFSAHISLAMNPKAFAGVQFVQSFPQQHWHHINPDPPSGASVPHCSLVSAALCGLQVSSLIQTHTESVAEDEDNHATVSSLQLSLKGGCSSVQLSLAVQFSVGTFPSSFPNLLTNSSRLEVVVGPNPGSCSLLEMACLLPSFTAAAKVVTLEVSHKAVLTWEHVHSHPLREEVKRLASNQQEEVKNKIAVSVSMPQVWVDVAAPCTGRPGASTGGLDLLVGREVGVSWLRQLKVITSSVQELMDTKLARDRRVLLAVFTNAARSTPQQKAGCVLLTPVASAVRHCVTFHCLHQLWTSFSAYSDLQLGSIPPSHSCSVELMAASLSLATRLFSDVNSVKQRKLQTSPIPIDPTSCPSCGPSRHRPPAPHSDTSSHSAGGYIRGVSPSPSELALPNIAFSTQQLEQVDSDEFEELYQTVSFTNVVVIRESLIPLLKAIGTPTAPQLRALCHNQHQFHLDCSVQLREGTVFVLEASSSRSLPTLRVEHAAVRGHLQANWATPATQLPNLCLLSSTTENTSPHSSKRNINGLFSANVGILSVGITVPLMKLSRHLIETSRILAQNQKPTKPTTLFTVADNNAETDAAFHQPSDMWHFIQELVGQLTALQEEALQASVRQTEAGPSQISLSRPSPAESAHSRSIRSVIADYSCSPKNITASSLPPCHPSPPSVPPLPLHTTTSHDSSTSEVAIQMEQVEAPLATSPASQSPLDTSGGDFPSSDEIQLLSRSQRISSSVLPPTTSLDASVASQAPEWLNDTGPLHQTLGTPLSQLSHSIFGLLRLDSLSFTLQVESSTTSLRLAGITGSVDSRQLATCRDSLPAYLSVIATITTTQLGVSDRALTESEMLRLVSQPIHCSVGLSNSHLLPVATYRCLLKVQGCKLVGKQPPVLVQKRFQQLLPTFTKIYQDVLSPTSKPTASQPQPQSSSLADMEMPSQLPQGYTHFSLSRLELVMTPLPSLSITYTVQPLVAHMETTQKICYQLSIGSHTLRFSPREHQVSLRSLVLPNVTLSGNVRRSQASRMPQVCMKLAVQTVNIDLTTDSLNQLLVLQNSFIKEVNELVQLFISMGDSLPQQRWQPSSSPDNRTDAPRPGLERRDSSSEPSELLSLLDSCQLSIDEICITVSTPLCTALRFSTSRIDMHVMNSGRQPPFPDMPVTRSLLLLSGRVDINVNLALGYLQDSSSEDDDFCELAYFRTKISIKNTQQSAPRLSLVGGASEDEASQPLDTFIISIISPHLYIQSSAVEQAILFWLNCKSVYSYWQHQRKLLNEEVQQATEKFVAQIQSRRPTTLQTPSLDFSKPRLVQIIVTDVGACMPMAAVLHTPQSSQKSFPALVLTIKEMLLVVNLSRKVASSGNFTGFCVRFANQFTLRQRTWTMDPKKNKMINSGIVNQGTFRLCVATKKRRSETDNSVVLGEKLVWAFQWDMSGIDVNANIDIGHHMSTLVRTATTIGTNLEEQQPTHLARSDPATPPSKPPRKMHKRAMSEVGPSRHEAKRHRMEEGLTNLAKGTIHVSTLQSSGASRDSLKREFEALKETEQELRKRVGRLFRRRGFNIQRIAEFFRSSNTEREGSMRRRWTLRHPRRLFSTGDHQPAIPEEEEEEKPPGKVQDPVDFPLRRRAQTISIGAVRHARTVSDVTDERLLHKEEDGSSSSPSLTPSVTPVPGDEGPSSYPPTPISSTPLPHSTFTFPPEGSSPRRQRPADLMASIDVEVNVTVNIESGIIKLRSREESEQKTSSPDLLASVPSTMPPPPLQLRRLQGRTRDSGNDRVILLIPALNVQVHYKSIIGQSYQFPSPSSSILLSTPTAATTTPSVAPNIKVTPSTPVSATQPELPMKRGVLSISVTVASTPEDMTLTPSLLEFVEQVVKPTIAATVDTKPDSSSDSDTGDDSEVEELGEEGQTAKEDSPISFPVNVTITFHMQPSTIRLSCYPHSRVHCIVCSPNVNFVVSFSLFSQQESEGPFPSPNPTSGVTFNDLFVTGCLETFTLQLLSPQVSTLKQHSDTTKMDNKEALSLTLGQALTHLSRKSVLVASTASSANSMNESTTHSKLQVSVVTNIASLVLGYDMRRLNDLSAFRRYWYRTSLIESFIGSKKPHQTPTATAGGGEGGGERTGEDDTSSSVTTEPTVDSSISAAIVVAAKVEDFRISANVAQVMGNTNLVVTHLQCQAHADISCNELVLLKVVGQMEKGEVDARGGMVAGFLLMQDVQTKVTTESHQGLVPVHAAQMSLSRAEARVDYMSSCILLGQASQFEGAVRDLWKGLQLAGQDGEGEDANIEVLVELSWAHLQLAIHRTTTKSVMNIVQKIQDFVLQQKRRSERTISIMLPADTKASKALAAYREKEKLAGKKDVDSVKSRHHWLWATRFGSLELMRALGVPVRLGQRVSLGGKLTLSGQNVCLVCFHGTSFRDHEWAVFNIDQLKTSFFTLAIPGLEAVAGPLTPTCQQICRLQLGEDGGSPTELATVHRVTAGRGRVAPITGTNINNWLSYACIDCHLHKQNYDNPTPAQQTVLKFSKKLTIQQILLVPGLNMELTNNHLWPDLGGDGHQGVQQTPPLVECGLSSQFSAGISVSTNVEHYLFLHDLVKNYIEYLERHKAPLKDAKTSESVKEKERENVDGGLPLRQFKCVRWELDPRLTLLSSVSGEFNPHISWLLETLGFKHARTTIPKWVQRGAMDPLDKAMAVALEVLIQLSAKKKLSPLHSI